MKHFISRLASGLTTWSGSVSAVALATVSLIIFLIFGFMSGFNDFSQLCCNTIMSAVSYIMLFMIQHVQNREALVTQIKLDALIESTKKAPNCLINVESLNEDELGAIKERYNLIAEESRHLDADKSAKSPS